MVARAGRRREPTGESPRLTPLDENTLEEAALAYLARRPASVARLRRVLDRKLLVWTERAVRASASAEDVAAALARAKEAVPRVIERLVRTGLLDDAAFAKHRAERLTRSGKSRRAVTMHLLQNGVAPELARASAASDGDTELAAAVALAKKKRMGPFARTTDADADAKRKWLGVLARAGYSFTIAERALRMDREAAEELLRGL